jgi:RHS repeat-associated protein
VLAVKSPEKGFVGGANDTATGLTNLGAREYQPGTGSFISPDPLLKPYDPQNLNAYAYASDNPATNSDPSGAMIITHGTPGSGATTKSQIDCTGAGAQVAQCDKPKGSTPAPSDSGCPPTELTCTVPAPLTKAGRSSYQKDGWVKTAPVSRPQTSAKPEFSCGGPYSLFRGWKGTCQAVHAKSEPFPWKLVLNVVGSLAAAGCTIITDGEEASICEDLANDGETPPLIGSPSEFNPETLSGLTSQEVEARIPSDWIEGSSKSGGGEVFRDPDHFGRQIRIMPGYGEGVRPGSLTSGPYAVVSQNGIVVKIPLAGNPVLK